MKRSMRCIACVGVLLAAAGSPLAQVVVTGQKAAPRQELEPLPVASHVAGEWQGVAIATGGEVYPFELGLAQWKGEVFGFGVLTVDPNNSLTGMPAVRLRGTIAGQTMTLGMSGLLDNLCSFPTQTSTEAYEIVLRHDAAADTIIVESIVEQLTIGCGQVFTDFWVERTDAPFAPGKAAPRGSWSGRFFGPPGWFFAPPTVAPNRHSFFDDPGGFVGWLEFGQGGFWGEAVFTWKPGTQKLTYAYECALIYTNEGRIEGNKYSGVQRYSAGSKENFFGVYVHTKEDSLVLPGPFAPPCP
jgi:hypothetical protein